MIPATRHGTDPVPACRLAGKGLGAARTLVYEQLPSTNRWVLDNLGSFEHGDVIRAIHQTNGHGRFSREWVSSSGSLTLSVVLAPQAPGLVPVHAICTAAAVAVAKTLHSCLVHPKLKWPNDVLINGLKASGILAEAGPPPDSLVILGVGINGNLTHDQLASAGLQESATSVLLATGTPVDLEVLTNTFIAELADSLFSTPERLRGYWETHDALLGKYISLQSVSHSYSGLYDGLDSNFALRLKQDDGETLVLTAGDVTLSQRKPALAPLQSAISAAQPIGNTPASQPDSPRDPDL